MSILRVLLLMIFTTLPVVAMVAVYALPNEMVENTQFGGLLAAVYVLSAISALYMWIIVQIKGDIEYVFGRNND